MPIQGLSDSNRLPRLGKVRIGIKVPGKTRKGEDCTYPKAVDYFVVPIEIQDVFGEQPKSLPVMLPSNEVDDNFPVYLKQYGTSRGLVCKGDGCTATRVDQNTGEMQDITCTHKVCPFYVKGECKEIGVLSFILPDVPGVGVWQIGTSSVNSILNLQSQMRLCKKLFGGRLAGIPFDLTVEPQQAQVKGKASTIYVLNLRSNMRLAELRALPAFGAVTMAALPSPDEMPEELYPGVDGEWENGREEPAEAPPAEPEAIEGQIVEPGPDGGPSRDELVKAVQSEGKRLGWTDQGFKARIKALVSRENLNECDENDLANLLAKMQEMQAAQAA